MMEKSVKEILADDFWIMPATPEYKSEGIPYITSKNIKNGSIDFRNVNYISKEDYESISKNRPIQNGDILISMIGTLGETAEVTEQDGTFYGQNMFLVRLDNTVINKRYFLNYFQSNTVKRALAGSQNQSTQKYLKANHIEDLQIPVPNIEEQEVIAQKLDLLSKVIAQRKLQLDTFDYFIKARFVEMFGGKYHEETLLNLCNIIDYRGKTPEKVPEGLPFITAKNIRMHQMSLEPREYISKETYDRVMVRGFPKEGDVVFTTEAPLGNVCRIPHFDTEFYIGQRIVTMQTEKLNPIYLEYALSTEDFRRKYMGKSSGSTVTGIRVRLLEQLTIPVPPNDIQDKFADFVHQVDKSKVAVQKALDETQMLFDCLMQEYFS